MQDGGLEKYSTLNASKLSVNKLSTPVLKQEKSRNMASTLNLASKLASNNDPSEKLNQTVDVRKTKDKTEQPNILVIDEPVSYMKSN